MDLSFALQALSVEHLAAADGTLPDGVQPVPDDIDREVARLKLASLGVQLDELTAEQRRYRRSWE
jgi:adenosylhomocysteinase